ncbi:hypothetical protein NKG99_07030 [Mesorhizobium sp. M1409]|uniref:hypothetical protein n=1 Tax=unclassified Mesorhizobium TaxID=325217 RepID=UPI00333B0765
MATMMRRGGSHDRPDVGTPGNHGAVDLRQRGLSVEAAAEIADVDVGVMRALVERRDHRMLDVYALGRVMEALEAAPESGRRL